MTANGKLPLANLRAVVFTQAWAGAVTTMLLGDMGAEVIQIEALKRPDPWRGGYAPRLSGTYANNDPGERPYDRNANFNSVNTNKRGITIDLNHQEGKALFLDLVRISDIVAENFSARVIPNFKLEYPVLRQVNPSIIMLRMPSYGAFGPYAMYMGNGGTTEPMSGISSLLGYKDGPPMNSGVMHTDPVGGMFGYASLLRPRSLNGLLDRNPTRSWNSSKPLASPAPRSRRRRKSWRTRSYGLGASLTR